MNALPEVLRYLRIAPVLAPDCLVLKTVIELASRLLAPTFLSWEAALYLAGCSSPEESNLRHRKHMKLSMHKGCLLQQYCSYGPSKACAGIHAASLLHTACKKKAWRAEVRRQGELQANRGCVTLQRRGCRSNSGLEVVS